MSIEEKFKKVKREMKLDVFRYIDDYEFDDEKDSIDLTELDRMISGREYIEIEEAFKIIKTIGKKKYDDVTLEKPKSDPFSLSFLVTEDNINFLKVDCIYLRLMLEDLETDKNKKEVKKLKSTLSGLKKLLDFRELLEYYLDIKEDLYNKKILRSFYVNELAYLGEETGVAYEIKTSPIKKEIFKNNEDDKDNPIDKLNNDEFYDVTKILFSLNYLIRTKAYYRYINKFLNSKVSSKISTKKNQKNKVALGYNFNNTGSNEYKYFVKRVKRIFKITGVDMEKFLENGKYRFTLDSLDIIIDLDYLRKINKLKDKIKIIEADKKKNEALKYLKENHKKKRLQADTEGIELIVNDMTKIIVDNLNQKEAAKQIKALHKKLRYNEKIKTRDIQKKLEDKSIAEINAIKNKIKNNE